nr:pollen-specific leucine-rich repeat extensin-like protein 1 isoform X1 [Ipomoea batatas]
MCYKGGGVIKSIEIVDPPKPPKPAEKPKEAPKAEKPKEAPKADKPKEAPKADKPKEAPKAEKPKEAPKADKPKEAAKPEAEKPKEAKKSEKPKGPPAPEPVPVPMKQPQPISNVPAPGQVTVMPVTHGFPPPMYCYEPSYEWYGTPVAPPPPLAPRPCYDNYSNLCRCGQARELSALLSWSEVLLIMEGLGCDADLFLVTELLDRIPNKWLAFSGCFENPFNTLGFTLLLAVCFNPCSRVFNLNFSLSCTKTKIYLSSIITNSVGSCTPCKNGFLELQNRLAQPFNLQYLLTIRLVKDFVLLLHASDERNNINFTNIIYIMHHPLKISCLADFNLSPKLKILILNFLYYQNSLQGTLQYPLSFQQGCFFRLVMPFHCPFILLQRCNLETVLINVRNCVQ